MTAPRGATSPPTQVPPGARRDIRGAWVSLAFLPVAFVLAMVVGEWLLAVQGFEGGQESAPGSAVLLASLPALLLLVTPGLLAVFFGLRARRRGAPGGATPAIVGAVFAIGSVGQNLIAFLFG